MNLEKDSSIEVTETTPKKHTEDFTRRIKSSMQGINNEQPVQKKISEQQVASPDEQDEIHQLANKASEHVSTHKDTMTGRVVEYYKLRGRIGEELANQAMPDSVNINDITGKSNFANFDLVSPHEMASVKVKELTADGEPRFSDYNRFFRDITNPNSPTNQRAAEDLVKLRQEDPKKWRQLASHLPDDVAQAGDAKQMASAMVNHSSLRITGDQVSRVRENLKACCIEDPAASGLDPDLSPKDLEEQAQRLTRDRIKSINKDYTLDKMSNAAIELQRERPHKRREL